MIEVQIVKNERFVSRHSGEHQVSTDAPATVSASTSASTPAKPFMTSRPPYDSTGYRAQRCSAAPVP